jgi:hypothetical protein
MWKDGIQTPRTSWRDQVMEDTKFHCIVHASPPPPPVYNSNFGSKIYTNMKINHCINYLCLLDLPVKVNYFSRITT